MRAPKSTPLMWYLEAPGGSIERFRTRRDARVALTSFMAPAPMRPFERVARGVYRYDPAIVRVNRRQIGPWLIYNNRGKKYLNSLEQLMLRFDATPAAAAPCEKADGL